MTSTSTNTVVVMAFSYLLGSIPFAYLLTKLKSGKDIREIGSGNAGATNVMRTGGKTLGIIALLLDAGKGIVAVLLGRAVLQDPVAGAFAGFCAALGHSYPVFLRFRGGKSVATGGGAFLILSPFGIVTSVALFIISLVLLRIVSLSSMIASASFPLFAWLYGAKRGIVLWGALTAALIVFRHKPNILRLIDGTERRIGKQRNG